MTDPRWQRPLSPEECADCLAIACCALDKIAEWTHEDQVEFGCRETFAKVALDAIFKGGFVPDTPD